MKRLALIIFAISVLTGCVPKVRLTVETRDPQGNVIDRADVTNSDANGRDFRVNSTGTIAFTAEADDSDGVAALDIEGGFSCNRNAGATGAVQQGVFNASDPSLPGQHPTSSSFQNQFPVQCAGGTFTGSAHACATAAKGGGQSCTKDASFK